MIDLMPFIIAGIATGAVYGLAGTGLVLTYKTSGIFNFGYGALATVAAYLFYWLHVTHGWDWQLSMVVSVFIAGPVLGLGMERIACRLAPQRTAYKIVGTVGLIVLVQGLGVLKYGLDPLPVPHFLNHGTTSYKIFGVFVQLDQIVVSAVAVIAVAGLYWLFKRTRLGVEMQAVVGDPVLVDLMGTSPIRVRRVAWMAGTTFAALSGVLVVPFIGLDSVALTFLVVQAFGAACVGAFSNIPLTFLGGLIVGIGASVAQKYVVVHPGLAGLPDSIPFIFLFVALLALPRRRLVPAPMLENRPRLPYKGPPALRAGAGVIAVGVLAIPPLFAGPKLGFYSTALVTMIIVMALGLLVRTSGQVALCQVTFMAVGACAFSQLTAAGWPWLIALLVSALIAVPVGLIVAVPAIRLSGLFLALATFGFGLMVERLLYSTSWMFGATAIGRKMPRPSFARTDTQFYYLILLFVVICALVMVTIHESRLGRVLRGMAESPRAVATLGLNTHVTRAIVFSVSAFIAAVGGILYGSAVGIATASDTEYQTFTSLILVVVLALAPFREPWYVLPAAIGVVIPAYWHSSDATSWLNVIFGVFAILVSIDGGPPVMPTRWRAPLTRAFTFGRRRPEGAVRPASIDPAGGARPVSVDSGGLVVNDLTVKFGGLTALRGASISARMNAITGLIGPNGAGKTTLFNAASGLVGQASGEIRLQGHDISGYSPSRRARQGLGRTFQIMELCEGLTVAENVGLGRESGLAGGSIVRQLFATSAERRETVAAVDSAMELCGIGHLRDKQAGELSTGERRLVDLARCLTGTFDMLLLDEPSSGLTESESRRFGEILRGVVAERRCGVLLVEHDIALVTSICDYVFVLDFGQLIFEGDATAVAESDVVRAAYLGTAPIPGLVTDGPR